MKTPVNSPPHPSLALPNHIAYKATEEELQAMHRRRRESLEQEAASAAAASPASSLNSRAVMGKAPAPAAPPPKSISLAPALPRALSKAEQATAAVAYSKEHSVSVVQALKTLGYAT
jgi:hypothetical protein